MKRKSTFLPPPQRASEAEKKRGTGDGNMVSEPRTEAHCAKAAMGSAHYSAGV